MRAGPRAERQYLTRADAPDAYDWFLGVDETQRQPVIYTVEADQQQQTAGGRVASLTLVVVI
jgi:hypothetical protein